MRHVTLKRLTRASLAGLSALALAAAAPDADAAKPKSRPAPAVAQPAKPEVLSREILALYDGGAEATPDQTRLHKQLEMPLNHLGYTVSYHDIRTGLPAQQSLGKYAAIATWFGERIPEHRAYLTWAADAASRGSRFIVIDFVGAPLNGDDAVLVNNFLKHIGVRSHPVWVGDTTAATIKSRDTAMMEFEHKLDGKIPGHMVFTAVPGRGVSHLSIDSDGPAAGKNSHNTDAVITSRGGGFVQYGFGQIYDKATERLKWVMNPFAFLDRALGRELWPIPDTTTIAGRRLYFSHIDGDGWNNVSEFKDLSGKPYIVSEIVRDRLIKNFPDLPVSIGLIACDIAPALGGNARASLIARELFEMRNVEVASHTHSHPYNWGFYANYNRDAELALHNQRAAVTAPDPNRPGETRPQLVATYASSGPEMPRANFVEPFDLQKEVAGALDASTQLSPPNKRAKLYLWSGNTKPFEGAIAATRAAGVHNMNGGDTRLDQFYPSVSYVPPISRPVGNERQIHAVNSNENTYTSGWSKDYGAFATVAETWANTDAPRRLKGANVYYHMYSGQKAESLAAVQSLLRKARTNQVIPITASHYAAVADSYFNVTVMRMDAKTWRILNRGALDTVRFDEPGPVTLDVTKSSGVLGMTTHAGALYVALDPAAAEPTVSLTSSIAPLTPAPSLVESRWQISNLDRQSCGFAANAAGFGQGDMTWRGLVPGRYTIAVTPASGAKAYATEAETDPTGELKLSLPVDAIDGVKLTVDCLQPPALAEATPAAAVIPQAATAPAVLPPQSPKVSRVVAPARARPSAQRPATVRKAPNRSRAAAIAETGTSN